MKCTLEIHHQNQWHIAAIFEPSANVEQQGYRSAGRLSYDVNYAGQHLLEGISCALSCRYPVSFEFHRENCWPAFLLDILPAGAGRRFWLQRLQLQDGASADWSLLLNGGGNPIGNLRVIRNETAYYEVARWFGVRTGEALRLENDALFIPRFDRLVHQGNVQRLGVESLASLAGVSEFGVSTSQNVYCQTIAQYATNPNHELLEFVRRDVLNTALGNTDNHGRNTAVIRYPNNQVLLSPLYDFAPMILDPQGIARVARWENEEEQGRPHWSQVTDFLRGLDCGKEEIMALWRELAEKVPLLPDVMAKCGVDDELIIQLQGRIDNVAQRLEEALQ